MTERVIGVLGGMGPEATIAFYSRVVALTPSARDQDHLHVIIESNPKVPDRTAAVMDGGPSPVPLMVSGIAALQVAGADFVVIPCVSAHIFLEDLRKAAPLPVLSILDVVADQIRQDHPSMRCVGLLATTGTVRAGLFQRRLAEAGLKAIVPPPEDQEIVLSAIHGLKAGAVGSRREQVTADLRAVAERLVASGAEGIVLGCTEIPLVLGSRDLPVPAFDALSLLAHAAIRAALREPVAVESPEAALRP